MTGIAQKKGDKLMKVEQKPGQAAMVTEEEEFSPPKWECGVTPEFMNSESSFQIEQEESGLFGHWSLFGRRGVKESEVHEGSHEHFRKHHEYTHSHSQVKISTGDDILSAVNSMVDDLDVHVVAGKRRRLYATDSFPQLYTYQVDLYIEIDSVLVENNGNDLDKARQYVNTVITAASTIYEREIDTHREFMC